MAPTHAIFAVIVFIVCYIIAYTINIKYKLKPKPNRYESIDGLRGFLGVSVFIHHASIWYVFAKTGAWELPKSNLYVHLGQTSVSLFFMISSFLFISKLLNSKTAFNWKQFYKSRLLRLGPLYLFSLLLLLICIMEISNWQIVVEFKTFIISILKWLGFTIFGEPILNNVYYTPYINGVVWSLPYEWLLYFSLPVLSIIISKKKPSIVIIIISLVFIVVFSIYHGYGYHHLLSFMGGAIAPFIKKYSKIKLNFNTLFFSILVLFCFFLIIQFSSSYSIICKLLITIVFTIIALGNNLFGILKNTTLKFLGEISYSTYLLHCIILFVIGYYIIGLEKMKSFSENEYCLLIFLIAPLVVLISFLSFYWIEKPFMQLSKKLKNKSHYF
ncbi:acyltransferase family protein [Pontimicrobium sp. MEBiC01747]